MLNYMSFSFWSLSAWWWWCRGVAMEGLMSTGGLIGRLSLSECSGLMDWLRNCEEEVKRGKLMDDANRF